MPLAFLFTGGIPWRLIGIVVGAVLVITFCLEIKHVMHLKSQLDAMSRIANDNAAIAEDARQTMNRANAIAAQATQEAKVTHRKFAVKKRKIIDALQTDDGPLAPVLRRALDGLPGEDGDEIGVGTHASTPREPDDMSGWP